MSTVKLNCGHKVNKKGANKDKHTVKTSRELLLAIPDSVYGQVIKPLGGPRFDVLCFDDGIQRQCMLKPLFKRKGKSSKNEVSIGSIVMVGIRDFQPSKGDIIYIYNSQEARELMNMGVITKTNSENDIETDNETDKDDEHGDLGFDFDSI